MFDIGIQELVIIFIVALLVFGPEKLPEVGRTLGKWLGEIRNGINTARAQMDHEFREEEQKSAPDSSAESDHSGKIEESFPDHKGSDGGKV